MRLSDQPHIDRIRDALWYRRPVGHAAIMVGAGFSMNARPVSAGSSSMPTWADLTRRIVDHLYPADNPNQAEFRSRVLNEIGASSGFLRLAEEYRTTFGRPALEQLLLDIVPDQQVEPAELHTLLLDLPWSDVFTTNWDTLLERAAVGILARRYDLVTTTSEIGRSIKPRIVKLHGSMPSIRPFIVTEEDYRTYPRKFAPFVNLVHQSMMENVFCLIGFSGDDPNFLQWAGWVRDQLEEGTPKIYLVGVLNLSPSRRRMLEDRDVVPVDLGGLPEIEQWPEHLRHRNAVQWFLRAVLERVQD